MLKAQIEQTRSTLRGDEANLNYTKIYAPMSGTVVSQNAKQGQTLNANQSAPIVVRIADLSTMTVQSQVSEADVSKLRVGQDVYFTTLGNQTKRWYGKLRQINPTPEVVNNVVLYNALFDVREPRPRADDADDGAGVLRRRAGERRRARAGERAAPGRRGGERGGARAKDGERTRSRARTPKRLPRAAMPKAAGAHAREGGADPRTRFANGRAMVRVVKADGTIESREVRVGVMSRVSAQIVSGLEAGRAGRHRPGAGRAGGEGEVATTRRGCSRGYEHENATSHDAASVAATRRRSSSSRASRRPTAPATSRSRCCTASTSRSTPASSSRSSAQSGSGKSTL